MDRLKRLRLTYEDCIRACDYCNVQAIVGDNLKIFEYAADAGLELPVLGAQFYSRCAGRLACTDRFVKGQQLSHGLHSSY